MKLEKRLWTEGFMGLIAALAMLLSIQSVSSACFFAFAQPKVPAGLDKYKNIK